MKEDWFESMIKDIAFLEKQAAEQNEVALFWLAWNYHHGNNGVCQDELKALELLEESAKLGYAEAQYVWAIALLTSQDGAVEPNKAEANKWFEKAANQGHDESMYELYESLRSGRGCKKDLEGAINWLLKAADAGHTRAQFIAGQMYYWGKEGLPINKHKAFAYFEKAAQNGDAEAAYCCGMAHLNGDGTAINREKGIYWLRCSSEHGYQEAQLVLVNKLLERDDTCSEGRALLKRVAEAGNVEAQFFLGLLYASGLYGFPQRFYEARTWLTKAKEQGHQRAAESLKLIEE